MSASDNNNNLITYESLRLIILASDSYVHADYTPDRRMCMWEDLGFRTKTGGGICVEIRQIPAGGFDCADVGGLSQPDCPAPHPLSDLQMGQGLWRVVRNQQLQQEYSEQCYLTRERSRRMAAVASTVDPLSHRRHCQGTDIYQLLRARKGKEERGFIDLEMLPPELSITILSYLNATDLCLASCVWQGLGNDEYLWQGLCKSTWGHCSIYNRRLPAGFSYRRLYMQLDEGSLTFNANPQEGMEYFLSKGILSDHPAEVAKFIFYTRTLNWKMLRIYLDERRDVLDELVTLHNFSNQFLPNALRDFFRHIHAPEERGEYLETLITKFSHRFCACNPALMRELGLSPDAVYVLCYSLILLSIDLSSPHVKNKMSKREFIRNTRRAAQSVSDDFVGHLYDNIYLIGHVAA